MFERKKWSTNGPRDYKERFEFKLTVGDIIICQRYFRINNFNETSLKSYDLVDSISRCVDVIDKDLKSKTLDYLEIFSPQYFSNKEEMEKFLADENNTKRLRYGHGIIVKDDTVNYAWDGTKAVPLSFKFDNGEMANPVTDEDRVIYKFSFLVDGREVCAKIWEGLYPKYIRNSIDLSNKRGRQDGEDITRLSFEQYLDYCIVKGRKDLVWGLINDICLTCSYEHDEDYMTANMYGDTYYDNKIDMAKICKIYGLSKDGMQKIKRSRK